MKNILLITCLASGVLLGGCANQGTNLEQLRINKEYSPFRECTAWAAKVLGEDAKPEEHLELTNSCLLMQRKDGFE